MLKLKFFIGSTPADAGQILKEILLREGVELDSDNALRIQKKGEEGI